MATGWPVVGIRVPLLWTDYALVEGFEHPVDLAGTL
jgi:hypothetical protein